MAYRFSLLSFLLNLNDIFHLFQLRKYIPDSSQVIQVNDVKVRENLTIEKSPLRVEEHKVKHLRGNGDYVGEDGIGRTCWWKHDVGNGESYERVVSDFVSFK